ncbi:sensor histidine kinase [Phytoactinopolyspora halotolerans]|uniref:GAF domain-containing sensor histidine kinase n=1 Tax=Phytoactinopolyspora halotolerans TaxID=1981512 RepID=A0A6L9S9L9_9ACTN|nr:GAF domain-containing protein [Phytoactinopolyspora halotolerans]NEE00660.1 GAF domain-containing sensor histidine kinase [Phytoactinopolyspora halotolerans]
MDHEAGQLLPKLPLDELLTEVQTRLQAVVAARDGVHSLLEAVVAIGRDLELETVLGRIVESATNLVDCRYGALGVIGDDGQLAQFIPVGLSEEEIARIAEWPHGRGLLGMLIKEPQALRLQEISDHPESYGFPPGHPPMRNFLGVPIRVRDEVFGNLYLTEKNGDRDFDEQDETIVSALATAAGIAIENARLYDETRRRETWLNASAELTQALLSGTELDEAFRLVARRAREMAGADTSVVAVPGGAMDLMTVLAVDGERAEQLADVEFSSTGTLAGAVMEAGEPRAVNELRTGGEPSPLVERLPSGPGLIVPLGTKQHARGVLLLSKRRGGSPFYPATLRMLSAFADQAAVVLELADARKETERHGLVDDRERIARDLHDVVVQRLFASAMTLTAAVRLIDRPEVAERVQRTVDDLDTTIKQIRSTIFALQPARESATATLRGRVVALVESATEQLGFAPSLQMEGLLDTAVTEDVEQDLTAVLQESLSNVARHAQASKVNVRLAVSDGTLRLQVEDNGVGVPERPRRSGLANMAERADRRDGSFDVQSEKGAGTMLRWQVPVR